MILYVAAMGEIKGRSINVEKNTPLLIKETATPYTPTDVSVMPFGSHFRIFPSICFYLPIYFLSLQAIHLIFLRKKAANLSRE